MRKTKIVCTLGPASSDEGILEEMLTYGMNVARVNFSHGDYITHGQTIDSFRKVRDKLGIPAAVLLDTKGPEIRTGDFEGGRVVVENGQEFILTTENILGSKDKTYISYMNLPKELKVGDYVLIDDGKIKLKVKEIPDDKNIICIVLAGGEISNHKGVNVPNVRLDMEYLSEKDKQDILFGIRKKVDYIAASFMRRADDIKMLRSFISDNGGSNIKIISKIENTEGIENFEEILELSDGIMVARGDMGVEINFEKLPGIQKRIIKRCQQQGKICITATQMLESMIHSPVPTRAEITDVANAVFDGTSAVMLSGETAMGDYPVDAVRTMAKIAMQAEKDDPRFIQQQNVWHHMDDKDITNAVGDAACTLAKDIHAKAIIAITMSGYTAAKMSKFRPPIDIIAPTPQYRTFNQLSLEWGVHPVHVESNLNLDVLIAECISEADKEGFVDKGDKVVISAGVPLGITGSTNMIRVEVVK